MHKFNSLYAFGSVLTDGFNNESGIDLIVDFANIEVEDYADNYFDFKFSLQDILKRPVDLLEEKALKNPYSIQSVNQQGNLFMQGYEGMAFSTGRIVFLKRTIPPQRQNCKPHHITQ
ncbi:MAG: nucleotidyltransferase domain-containing protein [Aquabacterium sp.]|nr:nucleotidyltransferase domain-containing protein [Ferruginibacter sp.]